MAARRDRPHRRTGTRGKARTVTPPVTPRGLTPAHLPSPPLTKNTEEMPDATESRVLSRPIVWVRFPAPPPLLVREAPEPSRRSSPRLYCGRAMGARVNWVPAFVQAWSIPGRPLGGAVRSSPAPPAGRRGDCGGSNRSRTSRMSANGDATWPLTAL
jgi:hypothetical protein